jgi:hypothetical protein
MDLTALGENNSASPEPGDSTLAYQPSAYPALSFANLKRLIQPVKLYYTLPLDNMYYGDQDEPRLEETRLIPNSISLYSLKAKIRYYSFPNQESLCLVFDTLVSSPNIKELDLSISK